MDKFSNLEKYTSPVAAQCTKTYPQLEGICKEGDVVHIFFSRYKKDTILVHGNYSPEDILELKKRNPSASHKELMELAKKELVIYNEVVAKKGAVNIYDCFIRNSSGIVYNSSTLYNAIGPSSYRELFTKLPQTKTPPSL